MNRPRETGGDFFCVGVVESTCSLVLNWRVGFCFPPFEGGQGGCCFNLGGGKDVAVFKNDETVSGGN